MDAPFTLNGEAALITGGGTGLGLGMARCFVHAGARVVLVGRTASSLEQAADDLGQGAAWLVHDVTDTAAAPGLFRAAEERLDAPISILVNNAGIHLKKLAVETTAEELQGVLETHVVGAHALSRAVLPGMLERNHGHILFTASMASLFGLPNVSAYSAAKTALVGLTRSMATEVSAAGVRVNAIAPGWIESPMLRKAMDEERSRKVLERTPMGRFGEPDDIGWAAVYLSSPAAKFVTGVVLPVDGGASIGF